MVFRNSWWKGRLKTITFHSRHYFYLYFVTICNRWNGCCSFCFV